MRRAARLGDGWHCIRLTPGEIAAKRKTLQELCDQNNRSLDSIEVSLRATVQVGEPLTDENGERTLLTGAPSQIIDDLRQYGEAGLEYLVLSVAGKSTDATIESVRRFADEIIPKV